MFFFGMVCVGVSVCDRQDKTVDEKNKSEAFFQAVEQLMDG